MQFDHESIEGNSDEDSPLMATLTGVSNEVGPSGNGEGPISSLAATQKGIFEMSTVISQPGLKRVDSSEILHLTIHQVSFQSLFIDVNPMSRHHGFNILFKVTALH